MADTLSKAAYNAIERVQADIIAAQSTKGDNARQLLVHAVNTLRSYSDELPVKTLVHYQNEINDVAVEKGVSVNHY